MDVISGADTRADPENLTDMIRRCGLGDRAALRVLYESQAPRLKALALRITRSAVLAEDVLHEVFLDVWRRSDRFDPARGDARAWLTMLTRYRALDLIRAGAREISQPAPPEPADDSPDALARLVATAEGRALHQCLETLEAEARALIIRAFLNGDSHADLSRGTGKPLGTVKSTIRRGLVLLRKCLGS